MGSKITFIALTFCSWGSLTQAWGHDCPCVDKETVAINQAYHDAGLGVDNAVLSRLQNPELISMVKASIALHQAKAKELGDIVINAGIPPKPSDLSQGYTTRGAQAVIDLAKLSGTALDKAYLDYRAGELQRLITAFDTYFLPELTTPTMKAWAAKERPLIGTQYQAVKDLQQKIFSSVEMAN